MCLRSLEAGRPSPWRGRGPRSRTGSDSQCPALGQRQAAPGALRELSLPTRTLALTGRSFPSHV